MFLRQGFLLLFLCLQIKTFSQAVVPVEVPAEDFSFIKQADNPVWTSHKSIPVAYKTEIIAALSHFPELRTVPVRFRIRKSHATLKTRPTFISMFLPKGKRSYVITISDKSADNISPILFSNLPEDARIGIIGHELSHVADFSNKSVWQCFKVLAGHLSPLYLDSLEFNTDKICIRHGLGNDLETWSAFIRTTMHTRYWRGAAYAKRGDEKYERYMNPGTIEKFMTGRKGSPTELAFSSILLPQPAINAGYRAIKWTILQHN